MADYKNYIDGRWVESNTGRSFTRNNPATGDEIGTFTKSGPDDVDAAVAAAREAFNSWRLVPAPKRGEILYRFGQLLIEQKEPLARMMTEEMGKVISEARGDVQEGVDMSFYMAGEGRRQFGQTTPSELPNKWNMSVRRPLGVVGMITPWNFPVAIPTWKAMPALVTGNTIVWKPASYTARLAVKVVELLEEAGLPPGVMNLIIGGGSDAGTALVQHPDVPVISFTGSNDVGRQTAVECARLGKQVSLEMGGKNAVVVLDDADIELAVDGILWSAFGTSGQRCTAASRVVADRSLAGDLVDALSGRARDMKLGYGLDETVDIGPVVSAGQLERVHAYIGIGRDEGADLVTGGEIARDGSLAAGHFHQPTIFTNASPGMRISQEEIFGPVTTVIPVDSVEEAVDVANNVRFGLSAAVYTRDVNRAFSAMRDIYTGILYINAGTTGAEIHLPFGGTKETGNGHRESGEAALDVYTEWQSIYVDYSGTLQRAQIDT